MCKGGGCRKHTGEIGHDRPGPRPLDWRLNWRRFAREEIMRARKSSAAAVVKTPARAPVTLDDVESARGRLTGAIVDTDCDWSRTLSDLLGCKVWLKFENQQFTASFKERGALNRLSALSPNDKKRGVIAMSAG